MLALPAGPFLAWGLGLGCLLSAAGELGGQKGPAVAQGWLLGCTRLWLWLCLRLRDDYSCTHSACGPRLGLSCVEERVAWGWAGRVALGQA